MQEERILKRNANRLAMNLFALILMSTILPVIISNLAILFGVDFEIATSQILMSLILSFIIIPIYYSMNSKLPNPKLKKKSFDIIDIIIYTIIGLALTYILSMIANIINAPFVNYFGIDNNLIEIIVEDMSLRSQFLAIVVLAPIFEELAFRHVLLRKAIPFGKKQAVIFSGLAFGIFHGNIIQLFYTAGLGMFWGLIYLKHNSYFLVVLLHAITNLIGGIILPYFGKTEKSMMLLGAYIIFIIITGVYLLIKKKEKFKKALKDKKEFRLIEIENDGFFYRKPIKKPNLFKTSGFILFVLMSLINFGALLYISFNSL